MQRRKAARAGLSVAQLHSGSSIHGDAGQTLREQDGYDDALARLAYSPGIPLYGPATSAPRLRPYSQRRGVAEGVC